MLLIQSTCFLLGVYLLFVRRMRPRTAALAAVGVLWFPPVAGLMAVIWKDSQMTAFMVLGTALMLDERRARKLFGLALLSLGTAMRHNALVMTFPLVVILFTWKPGLRFWKRHALAFAAWIAVTGTAQLVDRVLTDEQRHIWVDSIALCDITSTLRYVQPTIPDDQLRKELGGHAGDPDERSACAHARRAARWRRQSAVEHGLCVFRNPEERGGTYDAVVRAWRTIVFSHLDAYLTYRFEVFRRVLRLTDLPLTSPVYNWFTDVQDPWGSGERIGHDAAPGKLQNKLRLGIHVVGATWVFHVFLYVVLSIVLRAVRAARPRGARAPRLGDLRRSDHVRDRADDRLALLVLDAARGRDVDRAARRATPTPRG